jgi:hypothetical protein
VSCLDTATSHRRTRIDVADSPIAARVGDHVLVATAAGITASEHRPAARSRPRIHGNAPANLNVAEHGRKARLPKTHVTRRRAPR